MRIYEPLRSYLWDSLLGYRHGRLHEVSFIAISRHMTVCGAAHAIPVCLGVVGYIKHGTMV